MAWYNFFVLLTFLLIIPLVDGRVAKYDEEGNPPEPDRNRFDADEIIKAERTVERRKDNTADIFRSIVEANVNFSKSDVARGARITLYQGDIIGNEETDEMDEKEDPGRQKRAAMRSTRHLWTKRGSYHYIPYVITSSNAHATNQILGAMGEWMEKVPCLKFVRRTNEGSYLSFFSGGGCYSMVGMQGGRQLLSIGRGCEHHGVIVHEIGHALGFWHEQSRPDRDSYVRINYNNIRTGMEHNFNKYTTSKINSHGQSYDFGSVMHYGAYAFSKNRRPTIERLHNKGASLGQRNGLSAGDVKQAYLMYCGETEPTKSPTGCTTEHRNCGYWAKKGYCNDEKYKEYMQENCCLSCKVPEPTTVPPPCINKHGDEKCNRWARDGLCRTGSCFMLKECCSSCKNPPAPTTAPTMAPTMAPRECKDTDPSCRKYSMEFCERRSEWYSYMEKNCQKTCNLC